MKSICPPRLAAGLAALALSLPLTGRAALIAYEGFDYSSTLANGASLTGQTGGTGWGGGWNGGIYNTTGETGLTSTLGGSMTISDATRTLALSPADGSEIWFSTTLNMTTVSGDYRFMLFQDGTNANGGAGFIVRAGSFAGIRALGTFASFSQQNGLTGNTTASVPATGVYTIVGRISFGVGSATDAVDIWLNPTNTSSVGALGAASSSTTAGLTTSGSVTSTTLDIITTSNLFRTRPTGVAGQLDEIRIGTSLSDVAAIPEPSSWAASAGVAAAGLVMLRRRRRDA